MWGAQGWNQWALQQPAMFNDIPHEQIDWAELAKQWIQMKQTPDPPPPLPPPLPPALPPPPGHSPEVFSAKDLRESPPPPLLKTPVPGSVMPEPFHLESKPFLNEPGIKFKKDAYPTSGLVFDKYQTRENFTRPKKSAYLPKVSDSDFWGKPHWDENISDNVDERLWNPPPVEPPVPILGKETFDYGHVRDNPPLAMQSIDYNHMSEFSYNSVYPPPVPVPETHYDQYWSQINVAPTISPIFLKKERSSNHHIEDDTNQIDAAKRKTLPAWIRDGLEKMEQDRLKRLEKEREAKESAEKAAKSAALRKESKDESSLIPTKSKFESDSEEGEPEEVIEKQSPPVEKRQPSPVEDLRTEEEKKQDLVLKVRRTLTEVLLSVTSSEMVAIAQDMLRKAISKAPARQLAPSTSLSSVASGLRGLASYGTESEASEGEEEESDSEEELHRKIKEKKRLFAVKERKIIADLEEMEMEEKLNAERLLNEKKSNKEQTNTEKNEEVSNDVNTVDKIPPNTLPPDKETLVTEIPTKPEDLKENEPLQETPAEVNEKKNSKVAPKRESLSSNSSSSSSDSESESSDKHKKRVSKETKKSKQELKRDSSKKDKKSTKKDSHRKRSRSRDIESSGKHRRERSRDGKSKKKKSKRSDSSSSSSDSSHKKGRRSSKYESSRNHKESRNKSRDDRKRKRSPSPSRSHRKSIGHSSRSNKHEEDKRDRRHKEEKRHHRRSPSPSSRHRSTSSKVPRKYRSSRSLSSESESSGKKSKKSRNR